jgi:uncharacterized protein (DUF2249 family)
MTAVTAARSPGEHWTEPDGVHIEVRGLAPPAPFVMILKLVDTLGGATPVVVHHDRDPVPLYAELAQRGWLAQRIEGEPGEFRLRLNRSA